MVSHPIGFELQLNRPIPSLSLSTDRAYRPRTRRLCRPSWPREESRHPPHSCPTSTATSRIWVSSFPHPFSPQCSFPFLQTTSVVQYPKSCHISLLQSTDVCCFSKLFALFWVAKSIVIMWCIFHLSSYNFLLLGLDVPRPREAVLLSLFIYCPMSIQASGIHFRDRHTDTLLTIYAKLNNEK